MHKHNTVSKLALHAVTKRGARLEGGVKNALIVIRASHLKPHGRIVIVLILEALYNYLSRVNDEHSHHTTVTRGKSDVPLKYNLSKNVFKSKSYNEKMR